MLCSLCDMMFISLLFSSPMLWDVNLCLWSVLVWDGMFCSVVVCSVVFNLCDAIVVVCYVLL